jgi:phage gpG-like protein
MDITPREFASIMGQFEQLPNRAVREAGPEFEMIAVGNMRRDMTEGVSPDGTAYAPLRFARPQGGNKPLLNNGLLRGALSAEFAGDAIFLRANSPGANLHQYGGTIVPVRAKALTIPLTREAVRAGGARNFPRPLFVLKRSEDPRGGALAERVGKGKRARIVVHYLLRKKVQVEARPYLGISKRTADDFADAVNRKLPELFRAWLKGG